MPICCASSLYLRQRISSGQHANLPVVTECIAFLCYATVENRQRQQHVIQFIYRNLSMLPAALAATDARSGPVLQHTHPPHMPLCSRISDAEVLASLQIYVVEMVAMATLTPVVTAMNRLEATATKLRLCPAFLPYISCSHKGCGRALRSACRQRWNVAHILRIFRHFFDRSKRGGSQAHCTPDASCTLGFLTGQGQSTTVMTHGCSRPAKRQQLEK